MVKIPPDLVPKIFEAMWNFVVLFWPYFLVVILINILVIFFERWTKSRKR